MGRYRSRQHAKSFIEIISFALNRFENSGGIHIKGGPKTVEKELLKIQSFRKKIAKDLPQLELIAKKNEIQNKIQELRIQEHKAKEERRKQQGFVKYFFFSDTTPAPTVEKIKSLQRIIPDVNYLYEYPHDIEPTSLRTTDEKLAQYEVLLKKALTIALEKERDRAIDAVRKAARKIESEAQRRERNERTKAMAAAHEGKTRRLAQSVKRTISHQLEIFHGCPYCGGQLGEQPHADHIYPVSKGGLSTMENMIYVCVTCNSKKRDMTLREFIAITGFNRIDVEAILENLGKRF